MLALAAFIGAVLLGAVPAEAQSALFHDDFGEALDRLDGARGPEAYSALRRLWATWNRADPEQVEEALLAAEQSGHLSVSARAYAGLLSAYARLRRGDLSAARKKIQKLGFVGKWLVVGPFDNEGKTGLETEYEPEADFSQAIMPGRAYSGKERPVRYRVVPDAFPYGYLDAASLVRPEQRICIFATTFVSDSTTKKARPITLFVGATGAFKLYYNGQLVDKDPVYRRHDADRFGAAVDLEPGPNNVTIKVCGDDRAPAVSLRIADATGRPDARLSADNVLEMSSAAALHAKKKRAPRKAAVLGPVQAFDRLVEGKTPAARDLQAYAEYLEDTDGDDPTAHVARNLAQRAAEAEPTVERMLLAARLADDRNQRARWIEKAERRATGGPPDVDVLLARAALERESLNFQQASPFYDQVLALDADNVDAILGRVEIYNNAGLRRTALDFIRRAVERNPSSVTLLNMYASQLSVLGRSNEANEAGSRYVARRFDDRSYLSSMIELSLARRNREAAERWVSRLVDIEPDGQWTLGVAAQAYRALGQPQRAIASYQRALALAPEDTTALRTLADLYGQLGRRGDQLALLQQLLKVRPQDKDTREYVEYVEPTGARPDEAYAWQPRRFLKKRSAPANGHNRRTLLDLTVTTVFENGLSSQFRQIVFQPLTDSAAALARQYAFQYQADRQRVQLRGARVFRGDGKVDEAVESGEGAANNPAIAMYTSARTFYVQFPRLEPGDVVELRYRVDDVAVQNEFADYFGEIQYLQSNEPVGHAEYVLIAPKKRPIHYDSRRVPGLRQTVEDKGEQRVYRFFASELAAIAPEPAMPAWPSVLGYVHVSTFKTWEQMGRWYWGLSRDQLDLDEATRELVRKIVKDKKTEAEKVKAVFGWVVQNTRYVALELGIYGYKPRPCVQTVARGWGDCKDKATVIVGMLRELGIPSTVVIVRSGLRGEFDSSVASLAPFDHAIAYVPSLNLYLDGTAEYAGSTELPIMDLGSVALLVNEGASKLVRLPQVAPEANVRRRRIAAALASDGSAALDVEHEVLGVHAPSWRRHYHAAGTQTERVTEELGGEFPGFDLRAGAAGISAENLGDFEQPVRLTARGTASRFARREGTHLSAPVTPPIRLTPSYASLSQRKTDVKLPPIGTIEDTFVVKLPNRSRVVSAPEPKRAESQFGSYSVEVEVEPTQVTVKSRIVVRTSVIAPKQYAAWQQFCADVDQAFTPRLVVASQ